MANATLVLDDKKVTVIEEKPTTIIIASPGPRGPAGATGPAGPAGASAAGYRHVQNSPSTTWVITHNLGKYPVVAVVDSAGDNVIGSITWNSNNQITLTFSAAFAGEAYLS